MQNLADTFHSTAAFVVLHLEVLDNSTRSKFSSGSIFFHSNELLCRQQKIMTSKTSGGWCCSSAATINTFLALAVAGAVRLSSAIDRQKPITSALHQRTQMMQGDARECCADSPSDRLFATY